MIIRDARSRTLAMSALSAAAVLLIGWSITVCTVDHGLDQLAVRCFLVCGEPATDISPDTPPDLTIYLKRRDDCPMRTPLVRNMDRDRVGCR